MWDGEALISAESLLKGNNKIDLVFSNRGLAFTGPFTGGQVHVYIYCKLILKQNY